MPCRDKGTILLTILSGVDTVVNSDEPGPEVDARLAKIVRPLAPKNSSQILRDHEIDAATFDQTFQPIDFFTIEVFATAATGDRGPFDRAIKMVRDELL
ncbi:MAG TPA: hypothetical protein VGP76_10405 [Planctomycetaceae bacterium]|jgi:hypothetical protein|nr:hypothetical protein [Planctomycetaceae bacterium]